MAAEVSSIRRLMNNSEMNDSKSSSGLVTRDLLGGYCTTVDSTELDLDLQVPSGFEKRLDMESGKLYLQKCNSENLISSSPEPKQTDNQMSTKFDDLNYPPVAKQSLNLLDDGSLDLKLVPSTSSSPPSFTYQSVCTLDKVKSALERAEKETSRKRSLSLTSKASSSPSSNSSSSVKDSEIDEEDNSPASFATGCPSCLMYVLISKSDPRCPRCKIVIASTPPAWKKPRIDLNISI